jgi:hypothetical protein
VDTGVFGSSRPGRLTISSAAPDDQFLMKGSVSALDFCVYLKRCEVQCSIYEDHVREIDLYHPDYYKYWARLKLQICSHLGSR